MEKRRINDNELKTELKEIRTQMSQLKRAVRGKRIRFAFGASHTEFPILNESLKNPSLSTKQSGRSLMDRMPPKRTSTSETPSITLDAIWQLINDGISSALKAQAAAMANSDNSNRNTEPQENFYSTQKERKLQKNHKLSTFLLQWHKKELLTSFAGLNVLSQCFLVASVPRKTE
ncbi:hypothetical protein Tco_0718372 [Tanacetum coccineum]